MEEGVAVATWAELVPFIRNAYEVIADEPDEIRILFRYAIETDEDEERQERSQTVSVAKEVLDRREEWVHIVSPFARVGQVDLHAVLQTVGHTTVVGGMAIMGDYVVLRHSLPLVNLDMNEFVVPLSLVASSAEMLERRFVGSDRF